MPKGRLVIGTRRYSSWSMRGWLAVRLAGLDVEDVVIPLVGSGPGSTAAIVEYSPSGLVPYLEHDGAKLWESLAICEYCAEVEPGLWPADRVLRAHARSASAEMHAGFGALRRAMPMNLGRRPTSAGQGSAFAPDVLSDVARIEAIWAEALSQSSGPFLYGSKFGAADAMYAPVVTRFLSYGPALQPGSRAYCEAVRAHLLVSAWYDAALAEPKEWLIPKYENAD